MNGGTGTSTKSQRRRARARRNAATSVRTVTTTETQEGPRQVTNQSSVSVGRKRRRNRARKSNSQVPQYLRTLIDPCQYPGVKLPDGTAMPTSTFALTQTGMIGTGVGGDSVMVVFKPFSTNAITLCNGTVAGSLTNQNTYNFAQNPILASLFASIRPVSACLDFEFIGPSTADGGFWDAGILPKITTIPTTVSGFEQIVPGLKTSGFASRSGRVLWRPMDDEDYNFNPPANLVNLPYCAMVASGLPSGVSYIRWRVTANMEGIPISDTLNLVSTNPSPVDIGALQRSINYIAGISPTSYGQAMGMVGNLWNAGTRALSMYTAYSRTRNQLSLEYQPI